MELATVKGVGVAHWNPRQPLGLRPRRLFAWTKYTSLGRRVNNFGDLLGPVVVRQLVERFGLPSAGERGNMHVLGAVGSIAHMLPAGAVVWGAGVNGKHMDLPLPVQLDIRAVRGPLTHRYLVDRGHCVPEVYGDPALLIDYAAWDLQPGGRDGHGVLVVPNLNDTAEVQHVMGARDIRAISPLEPLSRVVRAISGAELVIGSSLHAIIVAEALGVPARAIQSSAEPRFKYEDYYEGTGRAGVRTARTVAEAIEMGGVAEPPVVASALEQSFPVDLWNSRSV